jgi:hypothetical protein
MTDHVDIEFAPDEVTVLEELRETLAQVTDWPPESPLSFVLTLASRTRGKLGEMLVDSIAQRAGLSTSKASSRAYDRQIGRSHCEIKFSTEDPPRFQQVRDPGLGSDERKYDYLICVSGRPHGLVYWLIPAQAVSSLMDAGEIVIQHAMSDTKWFFPSRTASDVFSGFRCDYEGLRKALAALA